MQNSHQKPTGKTDETSILTKLTRRSFLAVTTATMASCNLFSRSKDQPLPAKPQSKQPSGRYAPQGPPPKNQAGNHPSNFSENAGVTFTRVSVLGNYIAITFDDGPHPRNTPRLLDMLAARNIKATFYVIGNSVDANPGILRRTVAEGHEIGNHTQTHRLLTKLSDSEVIKDLRQCEEAIGRAAGVRPRTMRPPYGGLLQRQRQLVLQEFGYPTILWSVDPLDWKRPGPSVVANRIISATSAGGIVLAHDLHSQTVDAMPQTLDTLLRRGFKFVTVSQLIAMQVESTPETPTL